MLNDKMAAAINAQIKAEFDSAYLYLSMSNWFESQSLTGFAHWMRLQYEEEVVHALRFIDYVNDRGGVVKLEGLDTPQHEWSSTVEVFQQTLEHERMVSGLIHNLVDIARAEKDHATENMLAWFVAEQIEEESTAETILDELKLIGEAKSGLFMINREMAQRVLGAGAEAK